VAKIRAAERAVGLAKMGNAPFSKGWDRMFGTREMDASLLMIGLDDSGCATTILYKLKTSTTSVSQTGVEPVEHKNISFTLWDMGGQEKNVSIVLNNKLNGNMVALIFVVDASDKVRIDNEKDALQKYLRLVDTAYRKHAGKDEDDEDFISDLPILVYANKNDKEDVMSDAEIEEQLGLHELRTKRKWHVQSCSVQNGGGLHQGLDWIVSVLTGSTT
jgi:ADP-ribosylation factor protein 1